MSQAAPYCDNVRDEPAVKFPDRRFVEVNGVSVFMPATRTDAENAETLLRLAAYLEGGQ